MTTETSEKPDRVWASRWYRITPRSFVHEELFFDSDRLIRVFAGESYKSFLLRKDGRQEYAHELGEDYRTLPGDRILEDEDNEAILIGEIESIRVAEGSLLRKPKLVIETDGRTLTYYHSSRKHDTAELASELRELYPSLSIESE